MNKLLRNVLKPLRKFRKQLKIHHLLLILICVLLLSHFGFSMKIREYFEGDDGEESKGGDGLPKGIPKSEIPGGQEEMYIKKTEIVPPVCPKCPDVTSCPKKEKCPPCPPCARCPEPAFECKKIPNYNRNEGDIMPRPVLSDFSQFGM